MLTRAFYSSHRVELARTNKERQVAKWSSQTTRDNTGRASLDARCAAPRACRRVGLRPWYRELRKPRRLCLLKSQSPKKWATKQSFTMIQCFIVSVPHFLRSRRNKLLILHDGYTYHKSTHQIWYCSKRMRGKCTAQLKVSPDGKRFVHMMCVHNHSKDTYIISEGGLIKI